jgi:hypothetical protein
MEGTKKITPEDAFRLQVGEERSQILKEENKEADGL